ncbi:MAG: hypothetical protein R3C18_17805 [Planctomycetaceae bacterium]
MWSHSLRATLGEYGSQSVGFRGFLEHCIPENILGQQAGRVDSSQSWSHHGGTMHQLLELHRKFVPYWLPSLVLILVAINQLRLAHETNLSPWKGGGFGMFSTIDSPGERLLHAEWVFADSNQSIPLDIPEHLSADLRKLTHLPSRKQLQILASKLQASPAAHNAQAHAAHDTVGVDKSRATLALTLYRRKWNRSAHAVELETLFELRQADDHGE